MVRGVVSGIIALLSCAIGMVVLSETTWGLLESPAEVIGLTRFDTIPLVIGIGEALLALVVYRLLSSSTILWPSFLLLLFIVLGWATYHVEQWMPPMAWNKGFLGYPSVLILGLWIGVFAMLTINRWVAPRIPGRH